MGPKSLTTEEIKNRESRVKRRLIPVPTAAYAEEKARWQRKADADNRPLSSWIRVRVLQTEAIEEELATRASERRDG
jgi:hypothetical protein